MSAALMLYTQQLGAMTRAGIPIDRALTFLANGTDRRLNQAFSQCALKVQSGTCLSEALREHPRLFPPIYPALVQAGEHSGALIEVFNGLADYLAKRLQYGRQLQAALTYPLVLLAVCGGLLAILMLAVIPALTPLFAQLGVPLPWLTRAVLQLAAGLRQPQLVLGLVLILVTGAVLLHQLLEAEAESPLRRWFDRALLRLPLLGGLLSLEISSRFCASLGMLLCSGMPLERSLRIVRGVAGNAWFARRLDEVAKDVLDGHDLSWAVCDFLPPLAVAMISNAEVVGKMGETLRYVGAGLSLEFEERCVGFTAVLEPIFLAATSAVVGVVSVAALLPWITLLSQLG